MNTHKAHFQFLPVTSSGCEVKVSISAKAAEECPWKTETAATLNQTVDFYNLKYRLYAWMQCYCTVVCMCFENKPLRWRVRIYVSLYMQRVIQSLAREHSRHGVTKDLSSFSVCCCVSLHQDLCESTSPTKMSILQLQHVVNSYYIGKNILES